jgi:hypothetical protein
LRKILLAGMEPNLARRYQNIVIEVVSEEQWVKDYGPNSPAQAVTEFNEGASLEATRVRFRRAGNIFALQEEAAHIQQTADPLMSQKLKDIAGITPKIWEGLSPASKFSSTRKVLEVELDVQEKLMARAQAAGDTEALEDAFSHAEDLSTKLADLDEVARDPANTRYLRWYDPVQPPSIFANPRLPRSKGVWSGDIGNSVWKSKKPEVRAIAPGGVRFRNGYPDFSPWSRGQINLGEMSGYGSDFAEADAAFANGVINRTRPVPNKFTRADFIGPGGRPNASTTKLYRQEAGLTWHHHQGGKLMLLVPTELHANVPHTGGASAARAAP